MAALFYYITLHYSHLYKLVLLLQGDGWTDRLHRETGGG